MTALFIFAILLGFYVAWNIGANDVANSVGTAVGSGALTLKQAMLIAAIFEFAGSFLLGSNVSETLESGIVTRDLLLNSPSDYLIGMLGALLATGVWLQLASYFGWPVSTTHSIIGAILGFGIIAGDMKSVAWMNMASIALSWVVSPLFGGLGAYMIFSFIRRKILGQHRPIQAAIRYTPWIAFMIFFVLMLIIFFDGLPGLDFQLAVPWLFILASLIGGVAAWIAYFLVRHIAVSVTSDGYAEVERIFMSLQVIVACFMAFAHGSNDVANVIGPLSGIINVLQGESITGVRSISPWLLVLGGSGIVAGLATWGWRVIETIGKKITQLTPSRGFAAGFGATITVMLASKLGLPISTTHVLVGAVLGVGFARGIGAINLNTVRDIFISWLVTVPLSAGLSILFFYLLSLISDIELVISALA
ncbi:MAG: inorganic phosphate transporter [Verrucomicrobia bacterium]|nr:inorganic phosphate transporter [Verrucomicrobiota bacterium]MBS0645675.1 inorganic phosphate transporter [Verrucomicrobiota bacterium]